MMQREECMSGNMLWSLLIDFHGSSYYHKQMDALFALLGAGIDRPTIHALKPLMERFPDCVGTELEEFAHALQNGAPLEWAKAMMGWD